mmetsp:Transcript_20797/g.57585  ORF Transcript_20797/g.57585 Transcript_20797/m.57585 type:complete len:350 (-) Transcript_20797:1351-2400(-)
MWSLRISGEEDCKGAKLHCKYTEAAGHDQRRDTPKEQHKPKRYHKGQHVLNLLLLIDDRILCLLLEKIALRHLRPRLLLELVCLVPKAQSDNYAVHQHGGNAASAEDAEADGNLPPQDEQAVAVVTAPGKPDREREESAVVVDEVKGKQLPQQAVVVFILVLMILEVCQDGNHGVEYKLEDLDLQGEHDRRDHIHLPFEDEHPDKDAAGNQPTEEHRETPGEQLPVERQVLGVLLLGDAFIYRRSLLFALELRADGPDAAVVAEVPQLREEVLLAMPQVLADFCPDNQDDAEAEDLPGFEQGDGKGVADTTDDLHQKCNGDKCEESFAIVSIPPKDECDPGAKIIAELR